MKKLSWVIVVGLLLVIGVLYFGGEGWFPTASPVQAVTAVTDVEPESCAVCHRGAGDKHQTSYDELYQDGVIKVSNIAYSFSSSPDTIKVSFKMTKNGVSFDGRDADALNIYLGPNKGTKFEADVALNLKGTLSYDPASGTTTSTLVERAPGSAGFMDIIDPAGTNGVLVVFGTDEIVARIPNSRVDQGKFPFAGLLKTGPGGVDYVSTANNNGCEKCHSDPFLKHGYIYGQVNNDPATDFYVCKGCHLDNLPGGHQDWQVLVDNPARAADLANNPLTDAEKEQYAYNRRLMNDVHMSHAMEFPYPQSMSNCVTCHEGKLDRVLTDANFELETCKSCHAVTGPAEGVDSKRAPALKKVIPHNFSDTTVCTSCHTAGGIAPVFSKIHTGYNEAIYTASGQKYSDLIAVTIDSASYAGNRLNIKFSAAEKQSLSGLDVANISPTLLVGIYGYDTKDYISGPHERTFDDNGDGKVDGSDARNLEYVVGSRHPRFTTVSAAGGKWEVTVDLTAFASLIGSDQNNNLLEIAVLPALKDASGRTLALNAPSRTFDVALDAFSDGYYRPIVTVANGCNKCHEALGTTFHTPDRGGNIAVCRLCHITGAGGSHLEVQSRSIDSYVHAIHSFQVFDTGDIDFTDPVAAMRYEHHIESPYPKHGVTDCESCHNKGTYNVSDQSKSMPALLSTSDPSPQGWDRNIGSIPAYITGPAAKACGGCHKAEFIKEDDTNSLIAFLRHTDMGGYLVEAGTADPTAVLSQVRDKIMGFFR